MRIRLHPLGALGALASVSFGIFLICRGNHLASRDWTYSSTPWVIWGTLFIILPVIILAVTLLIALAVRGMEARRIWRAGLTPQERAVADLAEAAILSAAAVAWAHHNAESRRRASQSALGLAPLNRVHEGILRGTERVNARSGQY